MSETPQAEDLQNAYDTALDTIRQLMDLGTFAALLSRAKGREERRVGYERLQRALDELGEYLYQGSCGSLARYVDTSADELEV